MVQLRGFLSSLLPLLANSEGLMNLILKSIKDSFIEKLDNKDLRQSRKGLPNLFVNTGLNTLDRKIINYLH